MGAKRQKFAGRGRSRTCRVPSIPPKCRTTAPVRAAAGAGAAGRAGAAAAGRSATRAGRPGGAPGR
ncbi:hypothetical protein DRB96_26660 [Streptomyces sp. ICC1]|nr:hypothetical protein DRB96_26660 [Streptomyces sp. ICC1]